MSNIKLVHSGGNSVSLTVPDSNPAANRTFKLPGADGSAGQFLKTDGNGALSFATVATNTSNVKVTRTSISDISGVDYYDATLPANCFKAELSALNVSPSGNGYLKFLVGTAGGIQTGGSYYKFCQNKIGSSTAGVFETNDKVYLNGYIGGNAGNICTTQLTFMKCGTGERWTMTSTTMQEGNSASQITVAHPQNGSTPITTVRYAIHSGGNFDSGDITWTCWSTT